MKAEIVPTILASSKKEFYRIFNRLKKEKIIRYQIDIMDGKFVSSKSILLRDVPKMTAKAELHLMVYHPESYLILAKKKGFKKIIFHYEAYKKEDAVMMMFKLITKLGLIPVLAINPETKISKLKKIIKKINNITLLAVHPGYYGAKFLPQTYNRIRQIRKLNKKIKIEIDGGVSDKNSKKLIKAGANILAVGSFLQKQHSIRKGIKKLK